MHANGTLAYNSFAAPRLAATSTWPWAEIVVGCLFSLCIIGLTHDMDNLSAELEDSVEAGRGMKEIEAFHNDVNAAPLHRKLGFVALLGLGAYCFATAPRDTRFGNYAVIALVVCCLTWLCASFLWSADWKGTLREFVRIVAYGFVALSMALRFRPQQLALVIMLCLAGSVFTAAGISVATGHFKPWTGDFRLSGTLHSNLLAHHCLVVILIAVALLPVARRVWLWRALLLAVFAVLILTKTRGALGSTLLGIAAIKLVGRPVWSIAFGVSLLGTLLIAGILAVVVAGPDAQARLGEAMVLGRSEGVTTLTGRIPLWTAVMHESRGNRLKGYGYGGFWTIDMTEKMSDELQWYPRHSHSAYVHTMVDLGYVGVGLFLSLLFACLAAALRMFRQTRDPAYKFIFGFLLAG